MNTSVVEQKQERKAVGALEETAPLTRKSASGRWMMMAAAVVTLVAASAAGWRWLKPAAAATYTKVQIRRGDLQKTISATGKVQALTSVQVGTQVSGTVSKLYADFNDKVRAGQLIAKLDPQQLEAQLAQTKSSELSALARVQAAQQSVLSADAAVASAKANVDRADGLVKDAQRTSELNQNLVKEGVLAKRQLDLDRSALLQAEAGRQQAIAQMNQTQAQAQAARSQLEQAKAEAAQARGAVQLATVNLDRTNITAPIDGVVVSRNVDVGQTVAASLQAPVLFLIANDLTKMQVLADIDEADVGQLAPDSKVSFTVDAFPAETFRGRISQIRLAPQTLQNVVTYTAVVDVENPQMKLKPGMTASVTATVAERQNVLLAPTAALRFRPENATPSETPRTPRPQGAASNRPNGGRRPSTVWKVEGETLKPVRVQLGLSDGLSTEVVSGELKEGDQVAVPVQAQRAGQTQPRGSMFGGAPKGVRR